MPAFRSIARSRLAAVLTLALAARAASAQPSAPEPGGEGHFLGARYRWGEMPLPQRILYDVVAIPANVGRWDIGDWAQLGVIAGGVAGLWLAAEPSADVRFDRWTRAHVNPELPKVWTLTVEFTLWPVLVGGALATWAWATLGDRPRIAQGLSLLGESVVVFHVYHLTLKVLIGRERPTSRGEGRVLGPFQTLGSFPSGTPSGHAGTLYASMGAAFAYFDPPAWLQVMGHVAVGALTVFNVVDHGHYASEVLWGGAMGWYVGRWVVAHRASPPASGERSGARVVPIPLPRGLGLAFTARF